MTNEYLLEVNQVVKVYESSLAFEELMGFSDNMDIATEADGDSEGKVSPSARERIKKGVERVKDAIKTFFERLFTAVANFFKNYIVGDVRVEFSLVTEINTTIRDFMNAFKEGTSKVINVTNVKDEILEAAGKMEKVITDHSENADRLIENVQNLKKEAKINKDKASKINATPAKDVQKIIETTCGALRINANKLISNFQRKLSDPVTGAEVYSIYTKYINVIMVQINRLYALLIKMMNGGKIRYARTKES